MISLIGGELYQWDTGRIVKVVPDTDVTVHEVHYSTRRMDYAYVLKTYTEDGVTYCAIPNIILQQSNRLLCYEVCQNSDGEETISNTSFDIIKRNKPEDYVYTETEHFTYVKLENRLDVIEESSHTHSNKEVLDTITQDDIEEWNKNVFYAGPFEVDENKKVTTTVDPEEIRAAYNDGKEIIARVVYPSFWSYTYIQLTALYIGKNSGLDMLFQTTFTKGVAPIPLYLEYSSGKWIFDVGERLATRNEVETEFVPYDYGKSNAGKYLGVNSDGIINAMDAPSGGSSDAVLYTEQTLTDEQKLQARTNIGALSTGQAEKTTDMTEPIGIDSDGKLWSKPGSGGTVWITGEFTGSETQVDEYGYESEISLSKTYEELFEMYNNGINVCLKINNSQCTMFMSEFYSDPDSDLKLISFSPFVDVSNEGSNTYYVYCTPEGSYLSAYRYKFIYALKMFGIILEQSEDTSNVTYNSRDSIEDLNNAIAKGRNPFISFVYDSSANILHDGTVKDIILKSHEVSNYNTDNETRSFRFQSTIPNANGKYDSYYIKDAKLDAKGPWYFEEVDAGSVLYTSPQTLTDAQKAQARANIDADPFLVTVSYTDEIDGLNNIVCTADKTYDEILKAYNAGKQVNAKLNDESILMTLQSCADDYIAFVSSPFVSGGTMVYIIQFIKDGPIIASVEYLTDCSILEAYLDNETIKFKSSDGGVLTSDEVLDMIPTDTPENHTPLNFVWYGDDTSDGGETGIGRLFERRKTIEESHKHINLILFGTTTKGLLQVIYGVPNSKPEDTVSSDDFKWWYEFTPYEQFTDHSLNLTGATVGQIAKIKSVDSDGKPTEWEAVDIETYTLPEATETELGGIKADNAQADDTQAVRKGTDGKLYTQPGSVTDAQVSTAVSDWLDSHPDATTTVADGSITDTKLSDDLYEQITGDARHKLTEVEVTPVPQDQAGSAWEQANFDGSEHKVVTTFFTPFTKTPRYIKVVNKTSETTIKLHSGYTKFRFANSADETSDGFAVSSGDRNLQFFYSLSVAPGETLLYDLQEYGRKGCEYFQFVIVPGNIAGKYTDAQFSEKVKEKVDVYYVYDTYLPQYNLPDDSGEFLNDLPVRYAAQGINNTSQTRGYAVVPYYPDTTYNIRGGYFPNILSNTLNVVYLLDDAIFNGRDTGIDFNSGSCGTIPLIGRGSLTTTQYDTSVNAGKDSAYAWSYHKTPPASELVGPKYIAFEFLDMQQDANEDKGEAYYKAVFDEINEKGPQNSYITRFNKQIPRSLYAQLTYPNPDYLDDGSKYYAMLSQSSKSPLVNAKWILFGDSLTDNYGGHDLTGNYFATKIAREFNMTFDNRAKSGSNIYRGGSGNYVSVSGMIKLDEFLTEIEAGTTEQPDYITIAFGTNSFAAQIGTDADTSETDTTVYGATKRFIEKLREKCPKSVFGFVLSPKQNWGSNDQTNARDVDGARTAIKTVCEDYGVPYMDMSTKSGITVDMLPDGIHISNDQSQNLYYHAMRRFVIGL